MICKKQIFCKNNTVMSDEFEVPDFFTMNKKNNQNINDFLEKFNKGWTNFIILGIALMFLNSAVVRVGAGERAVVFSLIGGVEKRVLGEGINFVVPILEMARKYDVRQATYNFASEDKRRQGLVVGDEIHTLTQDGQKVDVELTVRVRPIPSELWKLHKYIGPAYAYKVIFPISRTVLREVLATYPVEDVYSVKRQEIQNKIQQGLTDELAKKYFIQVEEVLIRNVRFSKEFQDAIDRKQQAYQEFLKMEYILEGERAKRDAKIAEAEGEAKAINLRVHALMANPEFVDYRRAQVYGKRAKLILTDKLE